MDRIISYEPIDSGSNPDTSFRWPLRLMVRTAASQAANVEFKSRRGHLWVGRIVAIAADCKSADFKSTPVRVWPCPLMFAWPS